MKKVNVLIILILSVLTTILWKFFLPLGNPSFVLRNIEVSEIPLTGDELFVYYIIASLVVISFIFPFANQKKVQPKYPYWLISLFVLSLVFGGLIIFDRSIKGIYLVNYLGDDFPFIQQLTGVLIAVPLLLFLIVKKGIINLEFGWLFSFLLLSTFIVIFSFIENGNLNILSLTEIKKVISKGHFLFYGTFLLGMLSYILSSKRDTFVEKQ